ncbi:MAG TPA: hypothetical protein VGG35_22775 [Streptosporangiaceae bacterium]
MPEGRRGPDDAAARPGPPPARGAEPPAGSAAAGGTTPGGTTPGGTTPGGTTPGAAGDAVAEAMQAAIGLMTASLDSPELERQALPLLVPQDADGLAELMAGMQLISEIVLRELYEATGEPPEVVLNRLALVAERRRGTSSAG